MRGCMMGGGECTMGGGECTMVCAGKGKGLACNNVLQLVAFLKLKRQDATNPSSNIMKIFGMGIDSDFYDR